MNTDPNMKPHTVTAEDLKRFSILDGLTDPELAKLLPMLKDVSLKGGEVLFKEEEASNEIYLVQSGSVEICKSGAEKGTSFVIAESGTGSVFGELAFLDGSPRSAMVRAATETHLIVIEKKTLYQLPFSHRLIENIARASSEKLRTSAANYVGSLEEQLSVVKKQHEFGQFFIYILSLMAVGMIVNNLLHTHLSSISPYSGTFFISYTVILLVPSLMILWKLKMPRQAMGITLANWKRSLVEGLLISAVVYALFSLAAAIGIHFGLLDLKPASIAKVFTPWYGVFIYLLHSAAQELFGRGFLQTAFEQFFDDETGIRSIGFTSLLFGLFHIHLGIAVVGITFVSSLVFGAIYRRHRNLIGVSLVHFVVGLWAIINGVL